MSRFTLSCSTCSTRRPQHDEIAECFEHVPAAGFKYWSLAGPLFWTPWLPRWADLDRISRKAREAGLIGCTEVYGPCFPTDSVEVAEAAAEYVALMFGVARRLDSPLVVFSGGARRGGGLKPTISGILKLLELVGDQPIRIALEPHHRSQIENRADYDTILGQIKSPQVGITLDTGHFHTAGVDWKALVRAYPERIYNVHVKDHIGDQGVPLGTGEIDLKGLVAELHAIGYEGALSVELEVADPGNAPRYIAEAYACLDALVRGL